MRAIGAVGLLYAGIAWFVFCAMRADVNSAYERNAMALDMGSWHQYCTQLIAQRGVWPEAAAQACNNTPLDAQAAEAVLGD